MLAVRNDTKIESFTSKMFVKITQQLERGNKMREENLKSDLRNFSN